MYLFRKFFSNHNHVQVNFYLQISCEGVDDVVDVLSGKDAMSTKNCSTIGTNRSNINI